MWPALILASNRKHKVIGRTTILINSTTLKNEIKYQGEFEGSTEETLKCLVLWITTPLSQKDRAALKLNIIVVVKGKLYTVRESKFAAAKIIQNQIITNENEDPKGKATTTIFAINNPAALSINASKK